MARQTREERRRARRLLEKQRGQFALVPDSVRRPGWMTRAYLNNHYCVMVQDDARLRDGTKAIRALVQRHDNEPIDNHWAELQQIKNELFGRETIAIEYYPRQSELIDQANIYWLWIVPENKLPLPELRTLYANFDK